MNEELLKKFLDEIAESIYYDHDIILEEVKSYIEQIKQAVLISCGCSKAGFIDDAKFVEYIRLLVGGS